MTVVRSTVVAFLTLACMCPSTAASAEVTIALQSGTFSVPYPTARPRLVAGTADQDFGALFDDGLFEAERCRPCIAGSTLKLGTSMSATGLGKQHVLATFAFDAAPVLIPTDGLTELTLTAPFTFGGRIVLSQVREPKPDDATTGVTLSGAGIAIVHLTSTVDPQTGKRLYFFHDLTYQFQ
jgi:hypothetical protein